MESWADNRLIVRKSTWLIRVPDTDIEPSGCTIAAMKPAICSNKCTKGVRLANRQKAKCVCIHSIM